MVKKCTKAAVDGGVLQAWQLVTEAVMGVPAAAGVGVEWVGGGELCASNPC
jgi:hypothetical protein